MAKYEDVDDYIAHAPAAGQAVLREIRDAIKKALPSAEESISWNVPFYRYHGHIGGFSAFENHAAVGCGEKSFSDSVRAALEKKGYKTMKGTFQIQYDQKVPVTEIKKMFKEQATINVAKEKS